MFATPHVNFAFQNLRENLSRMDDTTAAFWCIAVGLTLAAVLSTVLRRLDKWLARRQAATTDNK